MKKLSSKLAYILIGIILAIAGTVYAINVTVPQATQVGQIPTGLSSGNYAAGNLVAGSNITITTSTPGQITISSTGGTSSPAGSNTQIQLNLAGSFGASSNFTYATTTNTLAVTGTSTISNGLLIGATTFASPFIAGQTWLGLQGSFAGYQEVNAQNTSASTTASSNYVLTANNGNANSYYSNFFQNSSGFTNTGGISGGADDAGLFSSDNSLYLGTASTTNTNANLYLVAQNTNIATGTKTGLTISNATSTTLTVTGLTSGNCVQASTNGLLTTTGSACGAGGGVSGGTNGKVAVWTSASTLSSGDLLDNLIVSGVNATSSIVNFNIQGTGALDPFNIASSNGTSLLDVKPNGRIGFNTITPADTYSFQLGSPISTTTTVLISDLGIDYNSSGIFAGTQPLLSVSKNNSAVGDNIACFGTGGQGQQVCFKDQAITKFQYGVQSGSIDVGGGIYTANQVGDIGIGNYIDWADAVSQQMVFKTFSTNNNFVWNNGVGGQILTLLYNGQLGINSSTPGTTLAVKAKATIDPFDVASSSGTSVLHVAQNGTTTISSLNVASWVCSTSSGQLYNGCSITSLGKVTTYNGLTTTGQGVSPIVAENEVDGTTTAATILTYTPTATTTLEAGGFLNVTAVVTDVLNYRLTWTDENGASQTQNFVAQGLTSASISTTGYIPFPSASAFRVAANTQVKLAIVFTTGIGSVTYDTEGYLRVIK